MMKTETILGLGALVVLVGFIAFAFRQGSKVKRPPEGVPPERTGGGSLLN
jgi:hypothetical protein